MYDVYIMRRTQIYLTEKQGRLLERRARASGQTVSALIRQAVDQTYAVRRPVSREERIAIARRCAGAWKGFPETGREFVERIRGRRRLSGLHGSES